MIIYHQNNLAAFAGNIKGMWQFQPFMTHRISVTSAAALNNTIEQSRANMRFVASRLFGRVN